MTQYLTPMVKLIKHEEASKKFKIDLFYTEENMHYFTMHGDKEVMLFVPRGYLTDGATVPKSLQKYFPVWDTYYQAAVFHDYLCEYLTIYTRKEMIPIKLSRTEVDFYFDELMKRLNTNPFKRKLIHAGVVAYSHFKSIVYPSVNADKRYYEDQIRKEMDKLDLIREEQKKLTA